MKVPKGLGARLKGDVKVFLEEVRTRAAVTTAEVHGHQAPDALKTLCDAALTENDDLDEEESNSEEEEAN